MQQTILVLAIAFTSNFTLPAQTINWYGYKGLDPQMQDLGIVAIDTSKIKIAKSERMSQNNGLFFRSFEQIDTVRQVTCDEIKVFRRSENEEILFTLKKGDKIKLISVNILCGSMCTYDTAIRLENGQEYLIRGAESLRDKVW